MNEKDKPIPFPDKLEDWNPEKVTTSLENLYQITIAKAEGNIKWYDDHKEEKRSLSRFLRASSIALGAIGGIQPLIVAAWGKDGLSQWGYVLLAISGSLLGADKAFNVSSSWMRYITTQLNIEKMLDTFRYDWSIEISKFAQKDQDALDCASLIELLKEFVQDIDIAVENETFSWVAEFKSNLSELSKSTQQGKPKLPGKKTAVVDKS